MDIHKVLYERNRKSAPGCAFYLLPEDDSNGSCLKKFISELVALSMQVGKPYRLAVVYEFFTGHYTPLLLEFSYIKAAEEDSVLPKFRIYSTDSRALDVQDGELLCDALLSLPALSSCIELYGLGLDSTKDEEIRKTIRQQDHNSCDVYTLIDLELLLRAYNLEGYFCPHIDIDEDSKYQRCYRIKELPPSMMLYTQSIHGDDSVNRVGLKHYVKNRGNQADLPFVLFSQNMYVSDLFGAKGYESILSGLSNPRHSPVSTLLSIVQRKEEQLLYIGNKEISIRSLYEWHCRSDEKSFMLKVFKKIYENFSETCSELFEFEQFSYNAVNILSVYALNEHANNFHASGLKTNLLPLLSDSATLSSSDDESECDVSDKEASYAVISVLAEKVLGDTPLKHRFFRGQLGDTPASASNKNSPEQLEYPPPAALLPSTLLSSSFREEVGQDYGIRFSPYKALTPN